MADQVEQLNVGFTDDVSAGAKAATAALQKLGDTAVATEERVTRSARSGAALGAQYGDAERLAAKLAATSRTYSNALADLDRSVLGVSDKERLRANILASQAVAVQKVTDNHARYIAAMAAANTATGAGATIMTAGSAAAASYGQSLTDVAGAHGKVTGASSKMREGMVLVHEFMRGDWKRAVGSATIELQNFGLMHTIVGAAMSPVGIGLAATAVAVGVLGAAAASFGASFKAVTLALAATGDATGLTRGQIEQLAVVTAKGTTLSVQGAREVQAALLASGQVQGDLLGRLSRLSVDFAKATGVDAADAAKTLAKAMEDPAGAIANLTKQYNLVNDAQLQAIKSAQEQGNVARAQGLAADALGARFQGLSRNIGLIEWAWKGVAAAASDAFDRMGQIGRANTTEQGIAAARTALASVPVGVPERRAAIQAQLDAMLAQQRSEQLAAERRQIESNAARDSIQVGATIGSLDVSGEAALQKLRNQRTQVQGADVSSLSKENAKQQAATIDALTHAIDTYASSAQKATLTSAALAAAQGMGTQQAQVYLAGKNAEIALMGQVITKGEAETRIHDAIAAAAGNQGRANAEAFAKQNAGLDDEIAKLTVVGPLGERTYERMSDAANHFSAAQNATLSAKQNVIDGLQSITKAVDAYVKAGEAVQKTQLGGEAGNLVQLAQKSGAASEALDATGKSILGLAAGTGDYIAVQAKLAEQQDKVTGLSGAYEHQLQLLNEEMDKQTAGIISKTNAAEIDNSILLLEIEGTPKAASAIAQLKAAREQDRIELEKKIALKPLIDQLAAAEAQMALAEAQAETDTSLALSNRIDALNIAIDRTQGTIDAVRASYASLSAAAAQRPFLEAAKAHSDEEARALEAPFKTAISGAESIFAAGFSSIFDDAAKKTFDFAAAAKAIFIKLAADIAVAMVIKPVIGGVLTGAGLSGSTVQGLGFGSGAGAAQTVYNASGQAVGTVNSSGAGLSSLPGLPPGSLGAGGIGSGINNFLYNNLGIGTALGPPTGAPISATVAGPTNTGVPLGPGEVAGPGTTFAPGTSALSYAGAAASAAGFAYSAYSFAKNPTVIGGLTTAASGVVAGAAVAGTAAGAALLGPEIAAGLIAAGPYGWIALAVLAIASQFVGNQSNPNAGGFSNVVIGSEGNIASAGTQFSANGTDISGIQGAVFSQIAPFVKQLSTGLKADFSGITVGMGMSNMGNSSADYQKLHPNLMVQGPGQGADIIQIPLDATPEQLDTAWTKFATDLIAGAVTIDAVHGDWVKMAAQMGALGTTSKDLSASLQFITVDYDKQIAAYKLSADAGGSARQQMLDQANAAGKQLHDSVVGPMDAFLDKLKTFGIPLDEATAAQASYIQTFLGLKDQSKAAADVVTDLDKSVAGIHATFAAFLPDLARFSITAEQLADAEKRAVDQLDQARRDTIKAQINDIEGKGYLNVAAQTVGGYSSMVHDAGIAHGGTATAADMAQINRLLVDTLQKDFGGLNPAQLKELESAFDSLDKTTRDKVIPALRDMATAANDNLKAAAINAADTASGHPFLGQARGLWSNFTQQTGGGFDLNAAFGIFASNLTVMASSLNQADLRLLGDGLRGVARDAAPDLKAALLQLAAGAERTATAMDSAAKGSFMGGQVSGMFTGQGRDYLNQAKSIYDKSYADFMTAWTNHWDTAPVTDAFTAQFNALLKGMTAAQLQDLQKMAAGANPLADSLISAALAAQQNTDALKANTDAWQSQLATLTTQFNALGQAIDSLQGAIDAITTGALSPMGAFAKRQAALDIEVRDLAAARGGDATAAGRLGSDVQNFLTASAAYQTTASSGYAADYALGLGDLTGLKGTAVAQQAQIGGQMSVLQQQLHTAGVQGFAAGGITGNVARIHNNELLYTGPPARVWSADQSAAMLGGGSNDNAATRRAEAQRDQLIADLRAGLSAIHKELRAVRAEQAETSRELERIRLDRVA